MFPLRDNIPTERLPVVTILLIVANVLMYFLFQHGTISLGDPSSHAYQCSVWQYGAIPQEFSHWGRNLQVRGCSPQHTATWLTALTSIFMHGGLLHLGGNMLFLWIFGNNVEDAMGRVRYLVFYLLCGLAALATQILVDPNAAVPTIGASGAVAGVLGGYLLLYPRARVVTVIFIIFFFTILELPAILFLGVWIAQQVLFGYLDLAQPAGSSGGVAYFAHIGGFALGLALVKLFAARGRRR